MSEGTTATNAQPSGTYEAGCHCGYIKFSVTLSPPLPEYKVLDCNCSMCRMGGYLLVCKFTPGLSLSTLFISLGQWVSLVGGLCESSASF